MTASRKGMFITMKLRRIIAVILCAAIFAAALAGCEEAVDEGEETLPDETPLVETASPIVDPVPPTQSSGAASHNHDIDYDAAFAAFSPDTIMINAGEYSVTWAELYFHIRSSINSLLQTFGDIHNWSEIVYGGMTYADAVLEYASESALLFKALEYGAALTGAALTDADIEMITEDFMSTAEMLGGEEEYLMLLWAMEGISSREFLFYLMSTSFLANAIFTELYGANGELVSDEDAAEYTMFDGYMMAKHILRRLPEEGEDTALAEIEEILNRLDSYAGDDFEAFFDDLMYEYTEDVDGLAMFPNGYLFQYGDMVPEFYDTCLALEIGEYSGIVVTTYGYHLLYRLPINFDEIPSYYYRQYELTPLRYIVAMEMFDSALYGWNDSLSPGYTAEYESIDLAVIFDVGAD